MGSGQPWIQALNRFIDDLFVEQTNREELKNGKQNYVDLSINYQQGGATFSLFGRNLTEEDAYTHGLNVSGLWSYAACSTQNLGCRDCL